MKSDKYQAIAVVLIAISIAIGAFGTHVLEPALNDKYKNVLDTANHYFQFHALSLLVVSSVLKYSSIDISNYFRYIFIGVFLFSGSLYVLTLSHYFEIQIPRFVGFLTPIGGSILIITWIWLAFRFWGNKTS